MKGFAPSLAMEEWTEITAKDRLSQQKKRFSANKNQGTKMTVYECPCFSNNEVNILFLKEVVLCDKGRLDSCPWPQAF